MPYWTELDIARLLDVGNAYIGLLNDTMEVERERRELEKEYNTTKSLRDLRVNSVMGIRVVYDCVFCDVERKMWTDPQELPNFQGNSAIKEMREKLFEKRAGIQPVYA